MLADDIIMRVESTKVFGEEEDDKRVSCFLNICQLCNLLLFPDVDLEAKALLTDLSLRVFYRGSKLGHLFLEHHLHILGDTCAVYTNC